MNERYNKYKESYKQYRIDNKEKMKELSKKWEKENPHKRKEYRNRFRFGENKQLALERDNWTCQDCGMTNEQHILLFGRTISVHHKDKQGRNCDNPNNNLDNLITLCLRCHQKEHRKETK